MKAVQVVLVLTLVWLVAACGNGKESGGAATGSPGAAATASPKADASASPATASASPKASAAASAAPQSASPAAAATGERTIQHAMGTVTLKKQPERVVILYNGMVDTAVALGVKPVGAVESWDQKPWYKFLRDKMDGVKDLGEETQPNLEAIIALKPDLIIANKSRHEKIYPQLSNIAPTVMTAEVFAWKDNLKLSAQALYKDKEAEQILANWDKKVADFKQKVGSKLSQTEVSLMRFEEDGSSRIYITGFAGTIFKELGLTRPKAQQVEGKTVVNLTSKEQMAQLDGDYIFDITQLSADAPDKEKTMNDWTAHPLWKNLKGVKAGNYYKVDVITWNLSAGPLAAQSLLDDLSKYFKLN
ncbi:ABC transporter substrate-binding protein [Paenibacillus cymbidii]|uniref:ABC transporter substrate-binding protein n=1 Tax=Paenibacillus cymbidii TaxID=1639034 RepID=UPI001436BB87|nr:iron-siderophore ABC transporter substrate-binding protein [Paenibacillus cymbidii]